MKKIDALLEREREEKERREEYIFNGVYLRASCTFLCNFPKLISLKAKCTRCTRNMRRVELLVALTGITMSSGES